MNRKGNNDEVSTKRSSSVQELNSSGTPFSPSDSFGCTWQDTDTQISYKPGF